MTEKLRTSPNLVGCIKCGSPDGFVNSTPSYVSKPNGKATMEWLEWACHICGYIVKTKVLIPSNK